jgi:hypothetical protein
VSKALSGNQWDVSTARAWAQTKSGRVISVSSWLNGMVRVRAMFQQLPPRLNPIIDPLLQRSKVAAFRGLVDRSCSALSFPPLRPLEVLALRAFTFLIIDYSSAR